MSVTTVYHTPHRSIEDANSLSGDCQKKQICNVCEASFVMTRGCSLEKRCLACRFLKIQKSTKKGLEKRRTSFGEMFFVHEGIRYNGLVLIDESVLYESLSSEYFIDRTMEDQPHDILEEEESLEMLHEIIDLYLTEKQKEAITLSFELGYYYEKMTNSEIARKMKLTRSRVDQLLKGGLTKLRHPKVGRKIKNYSTL